MEKIFQIVRLNNLDQYFSLIEKININILNEYNLNLLHEAIAYQNNDIAIDLIKRGIDLDHRDKDGKTPLHYCANYLNIIIAKYIIDNGGDLNICDNFGNNPMWVAVFNSRGNYEMVKLFMNHNANYNNKNNANKSPLDFAIQIEDEELVQILQS
jgi:ankyrin repeat protein